MQGYGRTESEAFGRLHESSAYELYSDTELIFYAGPNDAQICFGDSGGPLYAITQGGELILISLASKTSDSECKDGWGVGPNLMNHLEWIEENTF